MLADRAARTHTGRERPRLAPPTPASTAWRAYAELAASIGIDLYPWQRYAARFLTARTGPRYTWREVAVVVARQNGKTTLLVPLIAQRMIDHGRHGGRFMHTAQNAKLPREVHGLVVDAIRLVRPDLIPRQRGVSYAIGNEFIHLTNGATYRIVASTRGGARGPTNDTVIVDEVRELESFDFIGAAKPTMAASRSPQIVYLSNAGDDDSAVLNAIRDRASDDPSLAYLEWSAAPDRRTDDRRGWLEANPSVGHDPALMDNLEAEYRTNVLQGTVGIFETEHLCRWVHTVLPPIIRVDTWEELEVADVVPPRRPSLGIACDPSGHRASAVLAWQADDGRVVVRLLADRVGDPVDVAAFGNDVQRLARQHRVGRVAYDSATDAELAKYFRRAEAVTGAKLTNASSTFVNLVEAHNMVWTGEPVTDDIAWTGRRTHPTPGTWTAIAMSDDHPVTGMLATIRAAWLASGPRPVRARVG